MFGVICQKIPTLQKLDRPKKAQCISINNQIQNLKKIQKYLEFESLKWVFKSPPSAFGNVNENVFKGNSSGLKNLG